MEQFDGIILGAGAAGLFCAGIAERRGRRIVVLERSSEPGRKVLISGGGRCNFTNIHTRPEHFLSANPHFAKSALARFAPGDFIELVKRHHIPYHEKTLGQLFCDRSAKDIVNLLLAEASPARIVTSCGISAIRRDTQFIVETDRGIFSAPSLVVACGGLSIPKLGATAFGYEIARQFGLRIEPPRPGLVPLMLDDDCASLAGVAAEAVASICKTHFREKLLYTHRGLSGPSILQISSYWNSGVEIEVDLLPGVDFESERESTPNAATKTVLARFIPRRLAERWEGRVDEIHRWRFIPTGTEGFEKAEVTCGGVDTAELSSKTMEARNVPGLFFIGEVVDVTGHLGGFNFQWAWASANAAGEEL